MIIRDAVNKDKDSIIYVLKASLGEADLPLSKEIWNYKHEDNPFGNSQVLLAVEKEEVVGVRAFMKWKWQHKELVYESYRAVDTATHPSHQGKGIFKRLTLNAIDVSKKEGTNFIFNTPNDQSRPGYLNMGWIPTGKIKVGLMLAINSFINFNSTNLKYEIQRTGNDFLLDELCNNWNSKMALSDKIFTPKSSNYLNWRYEKNPLQSYEVYSHKDLYMAGYVKQRGSIKELRISECIYSDHLVIRKEINSIIKSWSKKFGAQVITFSPDLFISNMFMVKGHFGPILTIRKLNMEIPECQFFSTIKNWSPSIGDLELF
jgi:GNAT superfamily N-acetyltransferase